MAYIYAISFRIADKTVNAKTYEDRRQSLITGARASGEMGFWDGTTSFILVESEMNTYEIAKSASKGLSEKDDMLLVFDPSDMSAGYFGAVPETKVLGTFFPGLKKLP